MASRRLQVLAFVRGYFRLWGASPSYGEIASATGTNRTRVREAVLSLVRDGLLLRRPGTRGLALPDAAEQAAALLAGLGWRVDAVTKSALPGAPVLDYDPPHEQIGTEGAGQGAAGGAPAATPADPESLARAPSGGGCRRTGRTRCEPRGG